MLLFGSGIVPALLITGWVSAFIGLKLRYYANRLAAVTIIIMGVTMIMRGAGMPFPFMGGHEGHTPPAEQTGPSPGHVH
jgi:sulfite exporter TauE/SafE